MFLLISLLVICGFLFWYIAIKPLNFWIERGVKQGNPHWLFGDSLGPLLGREDPAESMLKIYRRFSKVRYSGMYQLTRPLLLLHDPELIKQIAVKDADYFTDHRSFIPDTADPLWGKNLFILKGQAWKEMRPLISPAFTSSKMRSMFILIQDCAEQFVNHFLAKDEDAIQVEMKDIFTRFGTDVVASVAFGFKLDSLAKPDNKFYLTGKSITDFSGFTKALKVFGNIFAPKLCEMLKIRLISEDTSNYFINLVNETVRLREEKVIERPDIIQILLEARIGDNKQDESDVPDTGFAVIRDSDTGKANVTSKHKEISNLDIAAQAFGFFFAGYESVTSLMTFMAYELIVNTEIQDNLRDEINQTWRECHGSLTYAALLKMKYMDMVASETLRKWSNLIGSDRVCTKPYIIQPKYPDEKPLKLEKGDGIFLPTIGLHHDPKYYPEPEKFDPERFSDENKSKILPYTYFPFGLGSRSCLGSRLALMETKAMFCYLLYNFEIVPTKKTQIPLKLSKNSLTMVIEGGLNVALKRIRSKYIF